MKKSILSAALLASMSVSAFASTPADPIETNVIWSGTVPALIEGNEDIYIHQVTDLSAGTFELTRNADGTLNMVNASTASFTVLTQVTDTAADYTVTLGSVTATTGSVNLAPTDIIVSHNGNALTTGNPTASLSTQSDMTIALSQNALDTAFLEVEDVELVITATLSIQATI